MDRKDRYGETVGTASKQGVDRFNEVRVPARVYAAKLATMVRATLAEHPRRNLVLDLTAGWGTTQGPYREAGFEVFGVDRDPESTAASLIMNSARFVRDRARHRTLNVDHLRVDYVPELSEALVVDFEPFGVTGTTELLEAVVDATNRLAFRLPFILSVGCNPRSAFYRVGPRMDWRRHFGVPYAEVKRAFGTPALVELWAGTIALRFAALGFGFHWQLEGLLRNDGDRKFMVVGEVRRT